MKKNKKNWLLRSAAVFAIALLALIAYVDAKSSSTVPVLMYHSFGLAPEDRYTSLSTDPKIFAGQMEVLVKNNYNIVKPDKIIVYMTKKEKMPSKTVAITADDGFMNFYEVAYPVLKKYNIPATIFVITDHIGRPGYLGWNQLREMSDSGLITIGSHTKTHPWLPTVSVDEDKLRDELAGSKDILEKGLGRPVYYIGYPNGGFNGLVEEAAKKYGYKGAFTTNPSKKSAIDDIYAIRRLKISSSSDSPLLLRCRLTRYYIWFKERR